MAKLSKILRERATKELQSGVKSSIVCEKFGISASAASYLKKKASGDLPAVLELEVNFSTYQLDRLKRLIQAGNKITEVAKDYEISRATVEAYCNKHKIKPSVTKISMRQLRTPKKGKK